jgi:hypothetical protein
LTDEDFGALGEYFMGQMMGSSHSAMNQMMVNMMGEEGEKQHIMHDIEYQMYNRYARAAENVEIKKDTLPPEAKIFKITINVGASERTTITKDFVYIAWPTTVGSINVSVAGQWKHVEDSLSYIKGIYRGKVKISVTEE